MNEEIISLCRLCLKSYEDLEIINDCEKDMIEIIIPQIELGLSNNADICKNCADILLQSFTFKSKCLEIEDNIQDYKKTDHDKIDLETVLGVATTEPDSCIKICRTCLKCLKNDIFIQPTEKNGLKDMFKKCLPELNIELTVKPVMCTSCGRKLKDLFDFYTMCLKTEENLKLDYNKCDTNQNCTSDTKVDVLNSEEIIKDECNYTNNLSTCPDTSDCSSTDNTSKKSSQVYCQWCHYATNNETTMRNHIFSCPVFLKYGLRNVLNTGQIERITTQGSKTPTGTTKRKAATAKTKNNVDKVPKVEKITYPSFDKEVVFVISDSDEENSGRRPKRKCTRLRKSIILSDTEADTDSDYDPTSGTDASNDGTIPECHVEKVREKKRKRTSFENPLMKSIKCQFCDFVTNSDYVVKIHTLLCKFNPNISTYNDPLLTKQHLFEAPAQSNEISAGSSVKTPQSLGETSSLEKRVSEKTSSQITKEPPVKYTVGIPAKKEIVKNSMQVRNTAMENPNESSSIEVQGSSVNDDRINLQNIKCQYCDFTTDSDLAATIHVSLCKFIPNVWKNQKPPSAEENSITEFALIRETPTKIARSLEETPSQEKCIGEEYLALVTEEPPGKMAVETPKEGELKNSTQIKNNVVKKPNKNVSTGLVDKINLESEMTEKTNRHDPLVDNDRLIEKTIKCQYCNFTTNSSFAITIHTSLCQFIPNEWKHQNTPTAKENSTKEPTQIEKTSAGTEKILKEIMSLPRNEAPTKIAQSLSETPNQEKCMGEQNSTPVTEEPPKKMTVETPKEREMLKNCMQIENNVGEKPKKKISTRVVERIDLERETNPQQPPIGDNSLIMKLILCQYCNFASNTSCGAQQHISLCKFNPNVYKQQTPPSAKENSTKKAAENMEKIGKETLHLPRNETSTKIAQPLEKTLNQERCLSEENLTLVTKEPPKRTMVESPKERAMLRNSIQVENTVVEKPNKDMSMEVVEIIDLESDAAKKTNHHQPPVNDNGTIMKSQSCPYCNFITTSSFAAEVHISLCELNPNIWNCKKPLTAKEKLTKEPAQIRKTAEQILHFSRDETSTKITEPLEETPNQEGEENSNVATKEPPEKMTVETLKEGEILRNTIQTQNINAKKPNENISPDVIEITNLESDAAKKTNPHQPPVIDNGTIMKSQLCPYCGFITTSSFAAQVHISLCKLNPNIWTYKKPPTAKENSMKEPAQIGQTSADTRNPNQELLILKKLLSQNVCSSGVVEKSNKEKCMGDKNSTLVTEKVTVETPEKGETLKNGMQTENSVTEKPNNDVSTVIDVIDLESNAPEKTNRHQPPVDDDCMIVDNPTGDFNVIKAMFTNNKSTLNEMEQAIKNNKRKAHSVLQVMVCNFCPYNSRSTYKMIRHASMHSKVKQYSVTYGRDYRKLIYCVRCAEAHKTMTSLQKHLMSCSGQVSDTVFLFRVGDVMHCTKCVYDTDDRECILRHVLKCGSGSGSSKAKLA